jgi:type VI secretion system protein ImpG
LSLLASEKSGVVLPQLKELLYILSERIAPYQQDVHALTHIACIPSTRRLGSDGWRGFVPGQRITLTVNDTEDGTTNPILFGGVLAEFFRSYTSYNSFVETSVRNAHKTDAEKTWPIQFGMQRDL